MNIGDYMQYMLALVFVLALIGLVAVAIKRFGISGAIGGRRTARIAILEAAPVDKRRRLLLIRRDNVEHLVMIGGSQDFVVESGIEHDPTNKLEVGSLLRPAEPPLTGREPHLQADHAPRRARRSTSSRDDVPSAEPRLDTPRTSSATDQQSRTHETQSGEPGDGQATAMKPDQPSAETPAAARDGDRNSADIGSRRSHPDRVPQRGAPTAPSAAEAVEAALTTRERDGGQENCGPCIPIRAEPKLHSRSPNARVESKVFKSELKAKSAAQPQSQRRSADLQQERAPKPKQARQARPHTQAETSQRTRPQAPTAQPAASQRVEPTIQTPPRQPSRQPQAVAGTDPDLLILNEPVARPRRA